MINHFNNYPFPRGFLWTRCFEPSILYIEQVFFG